MPGKWGLKKLPCEKNVVCQFFSIDIGILIQKSAENILTVERVEYVRFFCFVFFFEIIVISR